MGLAFGQRAAELQVFVLVTMNITTFTVGTLIATWHHDAAGWRKMLPMLRQPAVYAVLAALGLRELSWSPTGWPVWEPLRFLADGTIGFMLLVLGVQLSKIRPPPMGSALVSVIVIRLLLGPLAAWAAAPLFGLDGLAADVLILGAGAPAAINTALLAHEFRADTRLASAAVFYTTLLSAVTVSVVLAVLRLT
jgi:predicted permease